MEHNIKKGFTLIEILTAAAIFFMVMAGPAGFLVSALRAQQRALTTQELIDNSSYVLEYMSRALRMAKKDLIGSCIGSGFNYEEINEETKTGIRFKTYHEPEICQEFFLDKNDGRLYESKNGVLLPLTPNGLEVVLFEISGQEGWSQHDDLQPKVTIFLEIRGGGPRPEQQPGMKIQTTISQRDLDIRQ